MSGGTWGFGASPVIVDGRVIQNCDTEGPSRLVAVDGATGKIVWETPREAKPKGGWSTPTLIEHEGRRELVLNGEFGVQGYGPATGKELWFCEAPTGRGEPVPCLRPRKTLRRLRQARRRLLREARRQWQGHRHPPALDHSPKGWTRPPHSRGRRRYPFISSMSGIGSAYDAETGAVIFNERLGEGIEIAAAPLVANGLVYFQVVHGGEVIVVKPGKTLEIVAKNSLAKERRGRPSAPCRCPSATASSSAGIDAVLRREVRDRAPFESWRGIPLGFAGRF